MTKPATGFVLVTPQGDILLETLRLSREASKYWLLCQKDNGRYIAWELWHRKGWRCYPAELTVKLPSSNE